MVSSMIKPRKYRRVPIVLREDIRRKQLGYVKGDYIDVVYSETTANIDNVFISIDGSDFVPLKSVIGVKMGEKFDSIALDWRDTETGKTLVLLVGFEFQKVFEKEIFSVGTVGLYGDVIRAMQAYVPENETWVVRGDAYVKSIVVGGKLIVIGRLFVTG